ncbi:multidrug effflux MFS transporter [Nocardia aurantia]|uniref:Bicyclomycin resistance protein n=1 Tax=Nocardia aurantia TaxID=2585199 RepID=A0A7K0DPD1_9NOCA|nr:multidrug effflux MFS transporter [Nocardia aurantia]MQY27615.1 Bicyclomycin resistance protein [Nocardia aurantia]
MVSRGRPGVPGSLLVVLALLSALAPFSIDMYLPAFTRLAADLHTSAASVQLTLTTFLIGLALGQLVIGPLSDRLGRRRPLLIGSAIALLATLVCALAPNIWVLIAARFVQGFTGAAGIVISRAVAADRTAGAAAARIFTLFASLSGFAPVVAPLLGGALAPHGWRLEFWVLAAIYAVMFAGALLVVPESLAPERRHTGGFTSTTRAIAALLTDRGYLGYTLAFALGFGALMAYISASPFVIQNVLGLSTTEYTVVFATNALGMVVVGALASRLTARVRAEVLLTVGQLVMFGFGVLVLILLLAGAPAAAVLPALFVQVAAFPLIAGNATALAVGLAPHAKGTASALMGALQFTLGALVSPLVGLGGSATGIPMAVTVVASAALGLTARLLTIRAGRPEPVPAAH